VFAVNKSADFVEISWNKICRVSQELRSQLWDVIPEMILSQKLHTHMGPIGNGAGVMSF
jgi:hypothetical protein